MHQSYSNYSMYQLYPDCSSCYRLGHAIRHLRRTSTRRYGHIIKRHPNSTHFAEKTHASKVPSDVKGLYSTYSEQHTSIVHFAKDEYTGAKMNKHHPAGDSADAGAGSHLDNPKTPILSPATNTPERPQFKIKFIDT
ncbi:hypothetical protein M758_UG253300 [Ceratodon purpureus]|nr:hypothetical protein M758_UG253300 [Ceratodon purpureus]